SLSCSKNRLRRKAARMSNSVLLVLDVGSVRVGVAVARMDVRIPQPLTTLQRESDIWVSLDELIRQYEVAALVVGWPRGMEGQSTGQTKSTEAFVEELRQHAGLPVYLQDEALTSQKAESELRQ